MADGQTEKPAVPPPMETPEGEKKPESTGTPPNAMDEATFQKETGKIRDELTDMQTRADTLAADLASKDAWTEEDLKTSADLISEMRALETRANGLAAGTPEQETALATLKNNITNAIDTAKEAIHAEEQKEGEADEKKADQDLDGDGKPDAPADAPPSDMDFPTLMSGINNDLGIVNDVLLSVNTEDGWQPEELKKLSDLASVMPHLVDAVRALETKAATPEEKELATEARKQFDNAEAKIKDLSEKATESTKPQPEKTRMERVTESLGKGFEKVMEFLGKLGEALGNAFDKMGLAAKKGLLKLGETIPAFGFLAEMVRPGVRIGEIKEMMTVKLGEEKIVKGKNEGAALKQLDAQFAKEQKKEESLTFEEYVQRRIDALATEKPGLDQYTIDDLATFKTKAESDEEKKAEDKQAVLLTEAGLKEEGGIWKAEGLSLGKAADGTDITTVEFRKTGDTWEWRNNSEPAGKWLGAARFPTAGVPDDVKAAREKMNKVADELGIKDKPTSAPPATPAAPAETPEEKTNRRNTIAIKAIINAFNTRAGDIKTAIYDTDTWQDLATRFANDLHNEKYDTEKVKLELEDGDLEATDTTGSRWSAGISDWDIDGGESWASTLKSNPELALNNFLKMKTEGLDVTSSEAIDEIKSALRKTLATELKA